MLLLSKVKMFFGTGTGTGVRSSALTGERGAAKSRVISDIKGGGGSEDSAERVQSALTAVDFKETQDTAVTLSDGEDAGAHSDHEGSPATSLHNAAEAESANTIGPSEITVDVALTGNAVGKEDEKREKKRKEVVRYGRVESPDFWKPRAVGTSDWFTLETKGNWAWWVMGGYSVSVLLFRVADWLNGRIVPLQWFDSSSGNIVNQMIAPEGNDLVALLIGAIAPCLSAPLWEEIFYRLVLLYRMQCLGTAHPISEVHVSSTLLHSTLLYSTPLLCYLTRVREPIPSLTTQFSTISRTSIGITPVSELFVTRLTDRQSFLPCTFSQGFDIPLARISAAHGACYAPLSSHLCPAPR